MKEHDPVTIDRRMTVFLALLIDEFLGDPPNRWHPVAWMGSFIGSARRRAPSAGPIRQLAFGGLIAIGGAGFATGLGWLIEEVVKQLPRPLNWLLAGLALKTTFSLRGLVAAGDDIHCTLAAGKIAEARRLTSWHLVSRDTSALDESQVAAAAIESIAENTSDGIVAPLIYYMATGLPGALAYRYANTADAMLGYRDRQREWLGKIPACFDDLLNFVPARLTALLMVIASCLTGNQIQQTWSIWRRDRDKTASPNAGHPMSVAAGALGIQLEKPGHYMLGKGLPDPVPADISRGLELMRTSVLLGVTLALLTMKVKKSGFNHG